MNKNFKTAPLPFMGQKRRFLQQFKECLNRNETASVYVDLFGGSGLPGHTVKRMYPEAKVVYNDFDNYRGRIGAIPVTNEILAKLRAITKHCKEDKKIDQETKAEIIEMLEDYDKAGYVDYISLSSSLLFSMKYVLSLEKLKKETMYCCVRKTDYNADGYLDNLEVVSKDYKELFEEYKGCPGVVFLVDPPYLSTEVGTYTGYWKLRDYLDVLDVLDGTNYYYFTSNKSNIVELCDWIEARSSVGNPFAGSETYTYNTNCNYNSTFTDMMLVKQKKDE